MINEHDITKSMLETIRAKTSEHIKMINENEQDIINLEGAELETEKTEFMDIVSPDTEFGGFKIYPTSRNVVFSGKFNNGVSWQFSNTDGLYYDAPNMELDDKMLELLKKLAAHFENWKAKWAKKLATEYKSNGEV